MKLNLENKTALVTGAGSGIGREIAKMLAEEGVNVMITGRTESSLKETCMLNGRITYKVADITNTTEIENVLTEIKSKWGKLDILVNNAGWSPIHPFEEETMEEFDRAFAINVRAVAEVVLKALPLLKESRGNIINVSSTAIRNHLINMSIYTAAKGAVDMFTKIWAKEFASYGIRVNSVSPGPIETPIYEKLGVEGQEKGEHLARVSAGIPLGRFGKPEEVAPAIAFLASDSTAGYITGSDYCVDGGYGA